MSTITLAQISRYPVKGLSPQHLAEALLQENRPLAGDRRFALAHGASAYDAANPGWAKKAHFLNGARHPAIAKLHTEYSAAGTAISVRHAGKLLLAAADLTTAEGRAQLAEALLPLFPEESRGRLVVASASDVSFSDVEPDYLSLQSEASLADLAARLGAPVEPLRMRGNLLFSGAAPWAEMQWPGRKLQIGQAVLDVIDTIGRCPATMINPEKGERDLDIPAALERFYGHNDCGIYARVVRGGLIRPGDQITLSA